MQLFVKVCSSRVGFSLLWYAHYSFLCARMKIWWFCILMQFYPCLGIRVVIVIWAVSSQWWHFVSSGFQNFTNPWACKTYYFNFILEVMPHLWQLKKKCQIHSINLQFWTVAMGHYCEKELEVIGFASPRIGKVWHSEDQKGPRNFKLYHSEGLQNLFPNLTFEFITFLLKIQTHNFWIIWYYI